MSIKKAYNAWAPQYDTNRNKTRDLEAFALRETLQNISFSSCLEVGCGTGKNTVWLQEKTSSMTAVDFSDEMLRLAKDKISAPHVKFVQADITQAWSFTNTTYDLVSFSLVLEHIENLEHVFREASAVLKSGGWIYIGELHPFKQYAGSKARFDTDEGRYELECYVHHVSEFIHVAKQFGLSLVDLNEYFDAGSRHDIPRILMLLLRKE